MDNLTKRRLDYYYRTQGYKATFEGAQNIILRDSESIKSTNNLEAKE